MVVMGFVLNKPKPLSALYAGWQEMLEEHRQLIVMFFDLADSTKLSGQLDPEDLHDVP